MTEGMRDAASYRAMLEREVLRRLRVGDEGRGTMRTRMRVLLVLCVISITQSATDAAPKWGKFKKDHCTGMGVRQYSAVLHDIPWGQSWERTCWATPATISGIHFTGPTRCKRAGGYMWGEFDVPHSANTPESDKCPRWGAITPKSCFDNTDRRAFSAILWDIPSGVSWDEACRQTPGKLRGEPVARVPDSCTRPGQQWGVWYRTDDSCEIEFKGYWSCNNPGICKFDGRGLQGSQNLCIQDRDYHRRGTPIGSGPGTTKRKVRDIQNIVTQC